MLPMTILTLDQISTYPTRTQEQQLKMSLLAEYYETYLFHHFYDFKLSNGVTVRVDFHKENFCHLIGIDQIAEKHFPTGDRKLFMHKGPGGFKRAKSGKLEFSYLKNLHQDEYNYQEQKFYFFHFIHTMLESGNLKLVSYSAIPGSAITCDFMFHETFDNALLHLGVEKSSKRKSFFPKTFFSRYLSDNDPSKYVDGQTEVTIVSLTKVPR